MEKAQHSPNNEKAKPSAPHRCFFIYAQPPTYIVWSEIFKGAIRLKAYIEERAVEVANFIISSNATVRETAKKFGISKSTVHKDVTERLAKINPNLASRARAVLEINKSERHIRGGLATKEKYMSISGTRTMKKF